MDHLLRVDILSVEELLFTGDSTFVVLPGEVGELGIYPGHASLLTRIKPGVIKILQPGAAQDQHVFVAGGVLEVLRDSVIVLADHAIRTPELDSAQADERVEAEQRPVAAGGRQVLLLHAEAHVDAVRDAVAVGEDQRRPGPGLGLAERLQRLLRIGAHRHLGDIDVAIGDRLQRQVLARGALAGAANLATAPSGVAFDAWPPVLE
jgi:F-type H+-transporting ATPase subunit epsilon